MLIKSTYTAALFGVFIHPRTIMVGAITGAMAVFINLIFLIVFSIVLLCLPEKV